MGSGDFAVLDQEDIAALALGQVAFFVQQYRPGVGVGVLYLQFAHNQVQVVMGLGPGAEEAGWHPGYGGSGNADAIPVEGSAAGERDGVGFNQDGGAHFGAGFGGFDAPADALHYPQVLVGRQQRVVMVNHFQRPPLHCCRADPRVNPQVAQGVVEAGNVLAQLEGLAVEGAGGVENCVAVDETPVADGYADVFFRLQFAVEIDDIFRVGHSPASCCRAWR